MKYISALSFILTSILAIAFSLSNTQEITLTLWPLPYSVTTPIFLPILVCSAIGFIYGMLYILIRKSIKNK